MSREYFDNVIKPTFIENWPREICSLSIAQADIPMTLDEVNALGRRIMDFGYLFDNAPEGVYDRLKQRVSDAVERFPRGSFVRLGSRSPKDSWDGHRNGFKTMPGDDPFRFMRDASERVAIDLADAVVMKYGPHIFVREWVDIERWAEFRCFMKSRRLVGISQYEYGEYFVELQSERMRGDIQFGINEFFEQQFRNVIHVDDVVFDVFLKITGQESDRCFEFKLLEINPWPEWTDPCLFDWRNGGDFDGALRIVENRPPDKTNKYPSILEAS